MTGRELVVSARKARCDDLQTCSARAAAPTFCQCRRYKLRRGDEFKHLPLRWREAAAGTSGLVARPTRACLHAYDVPWDG